MGKVSLNLKNKRMTLERTQVLKTGLWRKNKSEILNDRKDSEIFRRKRTEHLSRDKSQIDINSHTRCMKSVGY